MLLWSKRGETPFDSRRYCRAIFVLVFTAQPSVSPEAAGTSAWASGAEQLESSLPFGIASLHAFDRAVVGFRERLAIIFGLLRIERSTLKLESCELGGGFVHVT